jgi:hypothetical protein
MVEDFRRALARVQSDYGFYVECQTRPGAALAGYDLSEEERSTLLDPERLAEVLAAGSGAYKLPPITIKICGTHDWINRAATAEAMAADPRRAEEVAREVEAIGQARTREDRRSATLRLMELLG